MGALCTKPLEEDEQQAHPKQEKQQASTSVDEQSKESPTYEKNKQEPTNDTKPATLAAHATTAPTSSSSSPSPASSTRTYDRDSNQHSAQTKQQVSEVAAITAQSSAVSPTAQSDTLIRDTRRAFADIQIESTYHIDKDYFESGDLESLQDGELPIGAPSPTAVSPIGSADTSPNRSIDPVNAASATSADSSSSTLTTISASSSLADATSLDIDWRQGQLLGKGSFGEVFLGLDENEGSLMAVKCVSLLPKTGADLLPAQAAAQQQTKLMKLSREISLLRSLHHDHIVEYRGLKLLTNPIYDSDGVLLATTPKEVQIFMEFVSGGSISHLLKRFGTFSEKLVRKYTKDILLGLVYLHRRGVIHRDIKGGNLLVDTNGRVKLADFGASFSLADIVPEDGKKPTIEGTAYWLAPEVIRQQVHGRKVDVWSLGCTVIEMISGRPPWQEYRTQLSALYHIGSTNEPPKLPDNLSEDGKDFVLWCLERDPQKRPNVCRLLEHPFITEPFTGKTEIKLPPKEKLKQSAAVGDDGTIVDAAIIDGASINHDNTLSANDPAAASSSATSSPSASLDSNGITPSLMDEEEEKCIAEFLKQEYERLKETVVEEKIKEKL